MEMSKFGITRRALLLGLSLPGLLLGAGKAAQAAEYGNWWTPADGIDVQAKYVPWLKDTGYEIRFRFRNRWQKTVRFRWQAEFTRKDGSNGSSRGSESVRPGEITDGSINFVYGTHLDSIRIWNVSFAK
jgi:hypothetical protein